VALLLVIGLSRIPVVSVSEEINVSLETISVIFTLAGIWGVFKFFRMRVRNIQADPHVYGHFARYQILYLICMAVFLSIIIINVFVYNLTGTTSGLFSVFMILLATLLFYPSKYKIESDLQINDNKKE